MLTISLVNTSDQTRSMLRRTHLLQTPDSFVRTALPCLIEGVAVIHAAPALGAGFLQYTAEIAPRGKLLPAAQQRFLFMLSGDAHIIGPALDQPLRAGGFAYLPSGEPATLIAGSAMRCAVIEKRYEALPGVAPPSAFASREDLVRSEPLDGNGEVLVRSLLPADFSFDFAVNTMTYAEGAALSQVEVHVMEHGLLMLAGSGAYQLGESTHGVEAGDFIWMAPFCPQWFRADAGQPAKYLIYKDFNRSPAL